MDQTRSSAAVELPRPGEIVSGKYRIESVLGEGGMGVVMAAVDTTLGRPVAIKFLSPHKATREGAVGRFLREARSAAAIQSEHVVRVFEVGTLVTGAPYIVMEHLRGSDLANVLAQRGALSIEVACDWTIQACEAVGEAHRLGIVHRDLKPSNLYLTHRPDGSSCIKVLDFGISKAIEEGPAQVLTATDMVMGTPHYMSPEQVRSLKNVDARADIWALGTILFELLTATLLYNGPSASAVCAMIASDPPTPLRARLPGAPPALEAAILRCLHKDPAGRFQDVAGLAQALVPFASEAGRRSAVLVSHVVGGAAALAVSATIDATPARLSAYPAPVMTPRGSLLPPTMGPGSLPPGRPSSPAGSGPQLASGPHPTTQNVWQQPGAATGGTRGSGSSAVPILATVVGVMLVGGLGVGGYVFVKRHELAAAVAGGDSVAVPPTTPPSVARPIVPVPTETARPAMTTLPPATAPPPGKRQAHKDLDGGGGGAPDAGKQQADDNAAAGRAAEQMCNHHTTMMNMAQSEAAHKQAAETAKALECRGNVSSRCERQVCLNACTYLHDQPCIQQITYVIEHGPPPKY